MGRSASIEEIAVANAVGGTERRKQERFPCAGPAEVVALESGFLFHGEIKDLSLTGCYILTGSQLELGRRSDVRLSLHVNGDSLSAPARVILVRPQSGAAFEFLPTDPEMRSALLALLEKLTAELTAKATHSTG